MFTADEVVKSPGIPDTIPLILELKDKGIPVISEIEFAARYTEAKIVGITGSNGKTTTTLLIGHMLKKAGLNVGVAGNVGESFAMQVATEKHDLYVLELSSFQLDGIVEFKPDVAVLLNITADHLSRYNNKMENYIQSKFRIAMNQMKVIISSIVQMTKTSRTHSRTYRHTCCHSLSKANRQKELI